MSYVHAGRLSNKLKETPEDQKLQLLNKKTEVNTLEVTGGGGGGGGGGEGAVSTNSLGRE